MLQHKFNEICAALITSLEKKEPFPHISAYINTVFARNTAGIMFACMLRAMIASFYDGTTHINHIKQQLFVIRQGFRVTYSDLPRYQNHEMIIVQLPNLEYRIDLNVTYPIYLTLLHILQKEMGIDGITIVSTLFYLMGDASTINKVIDFLLEQNVNPFKEVAIGEIGGSESFKNENHPPFIIISRLFHKYWNISATQKTRAELTDSNFITLENYQDKFQHQTFDYLWTSNVMSYFAINTDIETAIAATNDLLRICSYLTKPSGQMIHVTSSDDPQPYLRAACLINQKLHRECKIVRLPSPNVHDDSQLRVNIFRKI